MNAAPGPPRTYYGPVQNQERIDNLSGHIGVLSRNTDTYGHT